jgi:hypothetical protein
MDLSTWRAQFPEFKLVADTQCQAFLNAAALEIDPDIWGDLTDQGVGYLAAHKLTMSPFGQGARLAAKDGTTTYFTHYDGLRSAVTCAAYRVT